MPRNTSFHGATPRIDGLCRSWLAGAGEGTSLGVALTRASTWQLQDILFSSDSLGRTMVELQKTLGEGPAMAALEERGPVLVADLRGGDGLRSWVVFDQEAQQAGVHSYYALPLQIGTAILGVLTAHGTTPHRVDDVGGLLALADALAFALLDLGTGGSGGDHDGAALLGPSAAVIHQASGMVMAQTGETVEHALLTLQSFAYGSGRPLLDIAGDVVNRRMRFDDRGAHTS